MEDDKVKQWTDLLTNIVQRCVSVEAFGWLSEKISTVNKEKNRVQLQAAFSMLPRKTGRTAVILTADEIEATRSLGDGFSMRDWTSDRLCRLWLLIQLDDKDEEEYKGKIDALFKDAEMHELVALYSSLYLLYYPASWQFRTTEGIRSNIGTVLEAIMYENPYPSKYLEEPAWNQMVLKAFFTDKDVDRIIGLDERRNKPLADILIDYAHERWAAQRSVNPQLWRLVSPFIDGSNFLNIRRIFENGSHAEKQAAALACYGSVYQPAKQLLAEEPRLNTAIKENELNWHSVNTLINF